MKFPGKMSFLALTIFIFTPVLVFAKISLVEIMYDAEGTDSDKEWVAIVNDNTEDVDLSTMRLSINGTNHLIVDPSGLKTIAKGQSALVVDNIDKFKVNYPNFTGLLYDSSFSLTNTSGVVALRDDAGVVLDTFSYDSSLGAAGDGNSLQKINGAWKSGVPIFGLQTDDSSNSTDTSTSTNTSTTGDTTQNATTTSNTSTNTTSSGTVLSSHSGTGSLVTSVPKDDLAVSAGRERITAAGTPVAFVAKQVSSFGTVSAQSYSWSFGDGAVALGQKVSHSYVYPGEYVVVLITIQQEYSSVSRTNVKVIDPKLALTHADNEFITVKNNSTNEININNWRLQSGGKNFVFPLDTIIKAGKEIPFPAEVTSLVPLGSRVELVSPSGKTVAVASVSVPLNNQVIGVADHVSQVTGENSNEVAMITEELKSLKEKLTLLQRRQFLESHLAKASGETEKVEVAKTPDVPVSAEVPVPKNEVAAVSESIKPTKEETGFFKTLLDLPHTVILYFNKIF